MPDTMKLAKQLLDNDEDYKVEDVLRLGESEFVEFMRHVGEYGSTTDSLKKVIENFEAFIPPSNSVNTLMATCIEEHFTKHFLFGQWITCHPGMYMFYNLEKKMVACIAQFRIDMARSDMAKYNMMREKAMAIADSANICERTFKKMIEQNEKERNQYNGRLNAAIDKYYAAIELTC